MGNLHSVAGKITLINHVLHSISTFQLAVLDPPKQVIKNIERIFANFFWGQIEGANKSHWVSWKNCCVPIWKEGLEFILSMILSRLIPLVCGGNLDPKTPWSRSMEVRELILLKPSTKDLTFGVAY